jgi:hypothetical protein
MDIQGGMESSFALYLHPKKLIVKKVALKPVASSCLALLCMYSSDASAKVKAIWPGVLYE